MFEISEEFFVSLGLDKLPEEFWKRSIFQRPKEIGREMNCHASAWDFYDGKDFRLVFFNNHSYVSKLLYTRVILIFNPGTPFLFYENFKGKKRNTHSMYNKKCG